MFNSYEELAAAVEERREAILTLEVPIRTPYSPEYEAAKQELQQAKAMKMVTGGGIDFLGNGDNAIARLEERVASLQPQSDVVYIQYKRVPLAEWRALTKQAGLDAYDQYERVLPKTFLGVFGQDPAPDETPEGWVAPEPLSTDGALVSSKGDKGILPGNSLLSVVQAFMNWQNAGGDVTIRPTKSGRD